MVRIGANTKTFTATAILLPVEEGLLDLETPLAEYRPDIPEAERITIRMLLDMRSGIGNYTDNEAWIEAALADPARVWEPDELVRMGIELPRPFEPDAAYEYSNTNTVLLGQIAEQVAGVPLEDLFQDRLFGPSGMRATALPAPADVDLPEPFAHGYTVLEGTERADTTWSIRHGRGPPAVPTRAHTTSWSGRPRSVARRCPMPTSPNDASHRSPSSATIPRSRTGATDGGWHGATGSSGTAGSSPATTRSWVTIRTAGRRSSSGRTSRLRTTVATRRTRSQTRWCRW